MPTWWNWEGEIWLFPGQCWPYPLLHWEECCRQGPKRERLLWSPRRPKQSSLHRDYRELNYWTILYGDCNNIFYYPTSIWNAKRVLNAAQVMFNCLIYLPRGWVSIMWKCTFNERMASWKLVRRSLSLWTRPSQNLQLHIKRAQTKKVWEHKFEAFWPHSIDFRVYTIAGGTWFACPCLSAEILRNSFSDLMVQV